MKLENIDVLFFIEHIDREMKGTLEVKKWLEQNGLTVHVASITFGLYQSWKRFSPKVICYPYCKKRNYAMVELFLMRNPNVICVNLNYEQLLAPATEYSKRPQDEFAKKELIHFVWGQHFKNYLLKNNILEDNIKIVGKPEIQFLINMKKKQESEIRRQIALQEKLDENKRWIFVPFNDGGAFKTKKMMEVQMQRGGFLLSDLLESIEVTQKHLKYFFEYTSKVAKERKDVEIIYRPHPGVDVNNLYRLAEDYGLNKLPNFHIIRSYTIKEWLCSSQVCISNWSTTMVDAQTIGLKTYIFKPSLLSERRKADWMEKFIPIETLDDLRNAIGNNVDSNVKQENYDYYIDTSEDAVERWGKTLLEYVQKYKDCGLRNSRKAYFTYFRKIVGSEYRRIAKRFDLNYKMNNSLLYDYFDVI